MKTILEDMEQFFGADGTAEDDSELLIELADSLPLDRLASIFIADAAGGVEIAHCTDAGDKPLVQPAAVALGGALATSDCCAFSRRLGETQQQEHGLFGVRLAGAARGFLGGLTSGAPPTLADLQQAAPLLRVCAGLTLAARRALSENRKLLTQVQHYRAEDDTLKAANSEAAVAAIEQHEKRLREEQQRVVAEHVYAATEAANRGKSQFLANMSHEIRTPLNAILGFAEILRSDSAADEQQRRDYVNTICESGNHLLELINDVLDLSKIEAGRMVVEPVRCSPWQIVATVLAIMRARVQEKGLQLSCRWPDGIPDTISADPLRLKQLLMNLLGNAVKFTAHGEVQLVCRLAGTPPQAQMAFDVIDTGVGIPPEKLESIFDAFSQADNSVTREFGGTGLGLAISKRIAQAMGGDITARSEPGKGSTFTATVDVGSLAGVTIRAGPDRDAPIAAPDAAEQSPVVLPPARVLVAEDGQVNRKLFDLILRRAGAEVVTAENGRIAVDLARQQRFDVILMDMQMPVMDGYTATRQLRAAGITTPIIALTAHALSSDEQKCLQAGCSSYLTKPASAGRLLRAIADALASRADPTETGPAAATPPAEKPKEDAAIVSSLPADDPEFRQIVLDFVAFLEEHRAAMRNAWQRGDLENLASLAHTLKGTAGSAGFDVLTDPARHVEQLAQNRRDDDLGTALQTIDDLAGRIVVEQAPSTT
jgi:signal transduction histidine kinase/DNA-binding response OmpR family regulator